MNDAHVRTAFKHFFPMKLFLVLVSIAFMIGFFVGNAWGFISCSRFALLN